MRDKKIKDIFDSYHFLALQPFIIGCLLGIVGFALVFGLFGLSISFNLSLKAGLILIILNLFVVGGALVRIAYMRNKPKNLDNTPTNGVFNYKQSLQLTRQLQKELITFVAGSEYNTKSQSQTYNNVLRLLSFVVVFENEAYIFIRLPKNVASRRSFEELKEICDDLSLNLNLNTSGLQPFLANRNIGLGYVSRSIYQVMRLAQ